MPESDLKNLEDRVARLEAAFGAAAPRIPIYADPPAWPWAGGGGYRYPVHWPVGDPAPSPVALNRIYVDPPAWPWGGGGGYRPPVHWPIGDPPPVDYGSLPVEQLEATLHSINAEKARLASIEAQVTQHLEKSKKKG